MFLKPFTLAGYRNKIFFLPNKSLYFARYATVSMVIFRAWASRALAGSGEEWITVSAKMSSSKAFYAEDRLLCLGMDKFKEGHPVSRVIVTRREMSHNFITPQSVFHIFTAKQMLSVWLN